MIVEYWKDDVIYYVEFLTLDGRKISKALVLSIEYSIEEVKKIILEKFYNVRAINHIDRWEECLSLKTDEIQ